MMTNRLIGLAVALACVVSNRLAGAESGDPSGLYQIVSGTFSACCGIGGDFPSALPDESQSFVRLTVTAPRGPATLTFLGQDLQTVFSVTPCPGGPPIPFSFDYGFVLGNAYIFHVDPGPPPYGFYWSLSASNSENRLRIDGIVGMALQTCVDVPNHFLYTNVVAVLVPPPSIRINEFSKEGALLFVQGQTGRTNVIQASEDLVTWTSISTNVMPATVCPICPFILYQDTASTNLSRRFYRCFEIPLTTGP